MQHFWIDDDYREAFAELEVTNLSSLMGLAAGQCLSMHRRGSTFALTLPDGRRVFLKRDHFVFKKDCWQELLRGERMRPKCLREAWVYERLSKEGILVPQVVGTAWAKGLVFPAYGAIIMCPLPGIPLSQACLQEPSRKNELAEAACQALADLQQRGYDWPDSKAEHFFVQPDGSFGFLDMERLTFHWRPPSKSRCQKQKKRLLGSLELALQTQHTRN